MAPSAGLIRHRSGMGKVATLYLALEPTASPQGDTLFLEFENHKVIRMNNDSIPVDVRADTILIYPASMNRDPMQTFPLQIYPNPVPSDPGQLYIYSPQHSIQSIRIYNLQGILLRETPPETGKRPGNKPTALELGELKPGMYIVKVNTEKGQISKIFIRD